METKKLLLTSTRSYQNHTPYTVHIVTVKILEHFRNYFYRCKLDLKVDHICLNLKLEFKDMKRQMQCSSVTYNQETGKTEETEKLELEGVKRYKIRR